MDQRNSVCAWGTKNLVLSGTFFGYPVLRGAITGLRIVQDDIPQNEHPHSLIDPQFHSHMHGLGFLTSAGSTNDTDPDSTSLILFSYEYFMRTGDAAC